RFEDRYLAARELLDARGVLVDAGDVDAEFRKAGAGYQPDITGTDHGNFHIGLPLCRGLRCAGGLRRTLGRPILGEDRARGLPQLRMAQSEGDVGFEEADLVAAIETLALEAIAVEWRAADELGQGVRQLDLAAGADIVAVQHGEHARLQDVAPDH